MRRVAAPMVARFELQLLSELGFGLDLAQCASTGATADLIYVSPKSGRAVSRTAGEPWADKMLRLPAFLRDRDAAPAAAISPMVLRLTGFFLARHVHGAARAGACATSGRISSRRWGGRCRAWREGTGDEGTLPSSWLCRRRVGGRHDGSGGANRRRAALHPHQDYMEQVMRPTTLDVADPMAVFAFVLNSLPDHVKIYPTENYFYFTFAHNGMDYAGNIRLDASDRDQGKVQFAYYEQSNGWLDDTPGFFQVLDASNGVKLEKLERFVYRLTYKDKSVVFELNDLSQVKPPAKALAPSEEFIGPVFDDSGVRFFLVYNAAINNFLFILDETVEVADDFVVGPRERISGRQAHRLCLLSRPSARSENPDRGLCRKRAGQQLFRRTVRPAAGQFLSRARRCAMPSSKCSRT